MLISTVSVERFSLVSSRPFAEVLSLIDTAVSHPDIRQMMQGLAAAKSLAEMEAIVGPLAGPTGLMEFFRLDMGSIIGKESTSPRPSIRLLIGNPMIMRSMAKHAPDTASYAPVTVLIDERADGVHLSYDRMASFLAPYGSQPALAVARDLDRKVETLLAAAAG